MKHQELKPLTGYRPSRYERERLSQIEVIVEDGEYKIVDHSEEDWYPTEEQLRFLAHLLDDDACQFSIENACRAAGVKERSLKRWCRVEPEFLSLLESKVRERQRLAMADGDLKVAGVASGELELTKQQKWAIDRLLRIREFVETRKIRMIQINQQINVQGAVNIGMSIEELEKYADDGASTGVGGGPSAKTADESAKPEIGPGIIEGQTG